MAKAQLVFEKGPLTFSATTTANSGLIKGGQLVEADGTTGRIRVAQANSVRCLGVAMGDASPSDYSNADTADSWGNNITNFHFPPNEVAVAYQGVFRLTVPSAVTTIDNGDLVKCAALGLVVRHSQGGAATFDQIIGRCVEPGGIAAGGTGKILISLAGA
jgi:hypothetical protein